MTLPGIDIKRPSFINNTQPIVKRPTFDMRNPSLRQKRETIIGGGSHNRCIFCSAMMPSNSDQCTACGRTQPDISLIDSEAWRKRIRAMGKQRKTYTGQ